ncbi:MAG TPA: Uma2 family endonuclease [Pyrinomonadaceae bacterium]
MSRQAKAYVTSVEYLARERQAEHKSEYYDGEIFAMTGASMRHNRITLNIGAELNVQLRGRDCQAFTSDMRVHVSATGLYTYPDVTAICGEPELQDEHVDTLLNPVLIVEVLSKSTARYDRIDKFAHYRSIPSFAEYLLVSQDEYRVEHNVKRPDGRWLLTDIRGREGRVGLSSVGCVLALSDIYDRVSFD